MPGDEFTVFDVLPTEIIRHRAEFHRIRSPEVLGPHCHTAPGFTRRVAVETPDPPLHAVRVEHGVRWDLRNAPPAESEDQARKYRQQHEQERYGPAVRGEDRDHQKRLGDVEVMKRALKEQRHGQPREVHCGQHLSPERLRGIGTIPHIRHGERHRQERTHAIRREVIQLDQHAKGEFAVHGGEVVRVPRAPDVQEVRPRSRRDEPAHARAPGDQAAREHHEVISPPQPALGHEPRGQRDEQQVRLDPAPRAPQEPFKEGGGKTTHTPSPPRLL